MTDKASKRNNIVRWTRHAGERIRERARVWEFSVLRKGVETIFRFRIGKFGLHYSFLLYVYVLPERLILGSERGEEYVCITDIDFK